MARAGLYKDHAGGERGWTRSIQTRQNCGQGQKMVDGTDARPSEDTPGRYLE